MRAWIFPGQGAQVVGMAQDLAKDFPIARETLEEADDALGFSVSQLMAEGPAEALMRTANTQPAILSHSVAVVRVLQSMGSPAPDAVAGHSLGEYAALVAADAIDFRAAVQAVHRRGAFMQSAVPEGLGAMAAVIGLPGDQVAAICAENSRPEALVEAANFNDTKQTVIAGHRAAVEALGPVLKAAGARRVLSLPVSAPFHCALMAPVASQLRPVLESMEMRDPHCPVVANVTASPNQDGSKIVDLLISQVTGSVRWVESVQTLAQLGIKEAYELGPGRALAGMIKRIEPDISVTSLGTSEALKGLS
ncbi:MAG: [acyl-carrier-protein] S-malonyltransferase [Myxococcales bacterium]|nr:[acyl-carrier-protein] S-malonyltransferase [Myxococcales bacterium]